jgi:hypothetical protein
VVAVSRNQKKPWRKTMGRLACVLLSFFILGMLSCRACDCTIPEPEYGERTIVLPEPRPPAAKPATPVQPETEAIDDTEDETEAAAEASGAPRKKIIRSESTIMGYTKEQMEDPRFNEKLNRLERKTILTLEKLQKTDPRLMRTPSGVPAPPPEEEQPMKRRGKKRKKRKK